MTTTGPVPSTESSSGSDSSGSSGEVQLDCDDGFTGPAELSLSGVNEISYSAFIGYVDVELEVAQGRVSTQFPVNNVMGVMPTVWTFEGSLSAAFEPGVATATFTGLDEGTPTSAQCQFFVE